MDNFRRIGFLRPDDIPSSFQNGDSYVDGDKIAAIIFPIGDNSTQNSEATLTVSNMPCLYNNTSSFAVLNSSTQQIKISSIGTIRGVGTNTSSGTFLHLIHASQTYNKSSSSPYGQAVNYGLYYNKRRFNFPDTWYSFYFDVYGCSYATTTSLPSNWYWKPYVEE